MNHHLTADLLSATAFFNALLREAPDARVVSGAPFGHGGDGFLLPLGSNPGSDPYPALFLPLTYRSRCARHRFALPALYLTDAAPPRRCSFEALVPLVLSALSDAGAGRARADVLAGRITASRAGMRACLARWAADPAAVFDADHDFITSETSLLWGHAVHPIPKAREGFSEADEARYAPDLGTGFSLLWLAVHEDVLCTAGWDDDRPHAALARLDGPPASIPDGYHPIPMHPWQWQYLAETPGPAAYLRDGRIRLLGRGRGTWRATSSLRTVYGAHAPYMVKFSLSLRLTNSVRTLMPWEAARGVQVCRALRTPPGRALQARFPHFHFIEEPAYVALKGVDGTLIKESLAVFRTNPFPAGARRQAEVVATLTQDHPLGEPSRLGRLVRGIAARTGRAPAAAAAAWFGRFMDVALEPLLTAQADYGLLFGAHQQNLLLTLEDGFPREAWFRDCQGTGYSEWGRELLGPYFPELGVDSANVIDGWMGARLFVYYLIVNTTFGIISTLGGDGLADEALLLADLRAFLTRLRVAEPHDPRVLDYLLHDAVLHHKGNFLCNLRDINENAMEDPLSIYLTMPNPLTTVDSHPMVGAAAGLENAP